MPVCGDCQRGRLLGSQSGGCQYYVRIRHHFHEGFWRLLTLSKWPGLIAAPPVDIALPAETRTGASVQCRATVAGDDDRTARRLNRCRCGHRPSPSFSGLMGGGPDFPTSGVDQPGQALQIAPHALLAGLSVQQAAAVKGQQHGIGPANKVVQRYEADRSIFLLPRRGHPALSTTPLTGGQ